MAGAVSGAAPYTERTPRVAAARRLTRRSGRDEAGDFLAEGPQAVREALRRRRLPPARASSSSPPRPLDRHADIVELAHRAGVPVSEVTPRAAAGCPRPPPRRAWSRSAGVLDVPLETALAGRPALVAVLADVRDPGNAGTVLRSADAAGADAVVLAGGSVDPYNGKAVRASAGSLFHLPWSAAPSSPRRWPPPARPASPCSPPTAPARTTWTSWSTAAPSPLRRRGCSATRRGACRRDRGRARRPPGPHPDLAAGGEPEPGRGRRRMPVCVGPLVAPGPGRCRRSGVARSRRTGARRWR